MISPRENFKALLVSKLWPWQSTVDTEMFNQAVVASLTAMQLELPAVESTEDAAANHYRMEGAKQFVDLLTSLAETHTPTPRPVPESLNYES